MFEGQQLLVWAVQAALSWSGEQNDRAGKHCPPSAPYFSNHPSAALSSLFLTACVHRDDCICPVCSVLAA